jgi:hypothetical protein
VLLAVPATASADRGATCTLTLIEAHGGDAAASFDPALEPLRSLLAVPAFSIYKVFRRLFVATLEFGSIGQSRNVTFPGESLASLSAQVTYTGFAANDQLLVEFRLRRGGQAILEPTLRLSSVPVSFVVPWPDATNALIFVVQCRPMPEPAAAPPAADAR